MTKQRRTRQTANTEWTDDLSVRVAPWRSIDELVDAVSVTAPPERYSTDFVERVAFQFAVSFETAELAIDRVGGGEARRGTKQVPDCVLDPVAFLSFHRNASDRREIAVEPPLSREFINLIGVIRGDQSPSFLVARNAARTALANIGESERLAVERWLHVVATDEPVDAIGGEGTLLTIIALDRLIDATFAATELLRSAGIERAFYTCFSAAIALGVALDATAEGLICALAGPAAVEGTGEWWDACLLAEAAFATAERFADLGEPALEHALFSMRIHRRVTTCMLGNAYHRVGRAMLATGRAAERIGLVDEASDLYSALIDDFVDLVLDATEGVSPGHEAVCLRQLIDALDRRASLGCSGTGDEQIRSRCLEMLSLR